MDFEGKLLALLERYTFGNGGAYAKGIHYEWAKTEIERLHGQTYTNQEFLKRNLQLEAIELQEQFGSIRLHFNCSWDSEHGIDILIADDGNCTVE